jgi:hypothetical protein
LRSRQSFSCSRIPHRSWSPKVHYPVHKTLHPISQISDLILSSHLRLCLPSGLFPSGFPHQNPLCIYLLLYACYGPTHNAQGPQHLPIHGMSPCCSSPIARPTAQLARRILTAPSECQLRAVPPCFCHGTSPVRLSPKIG